MINARSETLLEKQSFVEAVFKRRCLVPTNGFYEWRRDSNRKIPMWIQFKTREPFAFPGLWDCWIDRDTGKPLYTFTIITTHANALLRPIHDRMPVMYRSDMGRQWLEQSISDDLVLSLVTQPVLSEEMKPTRFRRSSIRLTMTRRNACGGFLKPNHMRRPDKAAFAQAPSFHLLLVFRWTLVI